MTSTPATAQTVPGRGQPVPEVNMSDDITPTSGPNPSGLCMCGCGRTTTLSPRNRSDHFGVKRGQHNCYMPGHGRRPSKGTGVTKKYPHKPGPGRRQPRTTPPKTAYEVDPVTGCWLWKYHLDRDGYGRVKAGRKSYGAHRFAFIAARGPIPEGLQIDHLCRNRACINPDHMELVVCLENIRRGLLCRLSPEDAAHIRWLAARDNPPTDRQLGAWFGVTAPNIRAVRIGMTWRDVPAAEPPEPLRSLPRADGRGRRVKRPLDSVTA